MGAASTPTTASKAADSGRPPREAGRARYPERRKNGPYASYAFSPREAEIFRMVAKGLPNKTIAATLEISPYTVQTYMTRMFDKTGVRKRAALVAKVLGQGIKNE